MNYKLYHCFRREIRKRMAVKMAEIFKVPGGVRVGSYGTGSLRCSHAGEEMSLREGKDRMENVTK